MLFCDCGDTFQGTYLAQSTQGQTGNGSCFEFIGPRCNETAHWEFPYGPAAFEQRLLLKANYEFLFS